MAAMKPKRSRPQIAAVAMLVLALVMRLGWAVPPPAAAPGSLAAAFGEHALCLSAAASGETRPAGPVGDGPARSGQHADHDDAKCCQWHASGSIILTGAGIVALLAFATPADRFAEAKTPPPGLSLAWARARGPPAAAS
jgi:hypothetical protein